MQQSSFEHDPRGQRQQTPTGSAGIHEDGDGGRVTAPHLQWLPRDMTTQSRSLHLAIRGWSSEQPYIVAIRKNFVGSFACLSLNFKRRAACTGPSEILGLRLLKAG